MSTDQPDRYNAPHDLVTCGRPGCLGPHFIRREDIDPGLDAALTAADQPTTEPSTAAQALAQAVRESVAENTKGTSGPPNLATSYWEGYRDAGRELADLLEEPALLERYPALGTPLAPAPQPAADTEVQWGVRDKDGVMPFANGEDMARDYVTFVDSTASVVKCTATITTTVTRTPWEEA